MLSKLGFDLWADEYDQTVRVSEETNQYPFAGYKKLLNTIFNEVMQTENARVLDVGFGTGVLASKLYQNGHAIDGIDFSKKMIAIAQQKMPTAGLIEWDLTNGLPQECLNNTYDAIISTYTLHHLTDKGKIEFIRSVLPLLSIRGKLYIGDIAFETREQLEACREENHGYWEHDEFYFVLDELKATLEKNVKCEFYPMSHCSGLFVLSIY